MIRTQIQLTEEQYRFLREKAAEYDVSMAALIRQSVDLLVEQHDQPSKQELIQRALSIQAYEDIEGKSDVAVEHDKYLAEIYAEIGKSQDDLD